MEPDALLDKINRKEFPSNWKVVHAEDQVLLVTILGLISFGIAFNILYLVVGSGILYAISYHKLGNSLLDIYISAPLLALIPQLIAIGLTLVFRRIALERRKALLILMPEGFVEYYPQQSIQFYWLRSFKYQDIATMALRFTRAGVPSATTYDVNSALTVPQLLGRFDFQIHLKNGMNESWNLRPVFGETAKIAQLIVDDYLSFLRSQH